MFGDLGDLCSCMCPAETGLCDSYRHGRLSWLDCCACPRPVLCRLHWSWCLPFQAHGLWGSALWAEVVRKHKTLIADVISEKCPLSPEPETHCLCWRVCWLAWHGQGSLGSVCGPSLQCVILFSMALSVALAGRTWASQLGDPPTGSLLHIHTL